MMSNWTGKQTDKQEHDNFTENNDACAKKINVSIWWKKKNKNDEVQLEGQKTRLFNKEKSENSTQKKCQNMNVPIY